MRRREVWFLAGVLVTLALLGTLSCTRRLVQGAPDDMRSILRQRIGADAEVWAMGFSYKPCRISRVTDDCVFLIWTDFTGEEEEVVIPLRSITALVANHEHRGGRIVMIHVP